MERQHAARGFTVAVLVGAVLSGLSLALTFAPWRGPAWLTVDNVSILAQLLAACCAVVVATTSRDRIRWCWALLATMVAMYAAGDVLWLVYGGADGAPPILSVADLLYLLALVPGVLGLLTYPVTRGLRATLGPVLLDAGVLGCSALLASQVFVFGEVISAFGSGRTAVMLLVYPVTDVMLTCLVLLLLLRSVGEARIDVVLLGLTFAAYTLADNGYALALARGTDYSEHLTAVAYVLAPVFLGLAALASQAFPTSTRTLRRQLSGTWAPVLPDLMALSALSVSLMWWLEDGVAALLATTLLLLTGVRQLTSIRQAQRWRLELEHRVRERSAEVVALSERHRRLESMKYSFVTAVSHELRTPLTAIRGSLEVLDDGDAGSLPPSAQRVVAVAARGTRRLQRLVEDIIDLERLESGKFGFRPAPQELHLLFRDVAESLAPIADTAGIRLVVREVPHQVLGDADRIQQALVNLIGNAVKFTPAGGRIVLDAHRSGEDVEVTVRDQGRGIPADQLEAIFERFHQVDAELDTAKGGTGLGLTITRHIIEGHGGRIWVESAPHEGTTFHFTLPALGAGTRPSPDDGPRRLADTLG